MSKVKSCRKLQNVENVKMSNKLWIAKPNLVDIFYVRHFAIRHFDTKLIFQQMTKISFQQHFIADNFCGGKQTILGYFFILEIFMTDNTLGKVYRNEIESTCGLH